MRIRSSLPGSARNTSENGRPGAGTRRRRVVVRRRRSSSCRRSARRRGRRPCGRSRPGISTSVRPRVRAERRSRRASRPRAPAAAPGRSCRAAAACAGARRTSSLFSCMHLHLDAAQQLAQQDALVDALPLVERIADVVDLLPVLERRALVVAPELRAGVEGREVDQRLRRSRAPSSRRRGASRTARSGSGTPSTGPAAAMVRMFRFGGTGTLPSASATM